MLRGLMAHACRTGRAVGAAGLVVAAVAITAACSAGNSPAEPQPHPTPSSTVSAAESDASDKALTAYRGYMQAYSAAGKTADYQSSELRKYIGDPLLGEIVYYLSKLNQGGLIRTGELGSDPHVSEINIGGQPKTVTISDCLDSSNTQVVSKDTGKPNSSSSRGPTRTKISAQAYLYDDGRWLINKTTAVDGATC